MIKAIIKMANGLSNLFSVLVLIAQLIYIIQKFRQQLAAIIDRLRKEFVVAKVQTIVGFH
jgi:flagellar biogenesis protein FliO